MSKSLDQRQITLLKLLAKDVSTGIEMKPFEEAANLCEALAIMLEMIGAEAAANTAYKLVRTIRESRQAHSTLTRQLGELLLAATEPTTGEGKP